jgi:RNase P subunit RPR2
MESALFCARCSTELIPGEGAFYVVKIEAVADPNGPVVTSEIPSSHEIRRQIKQLISKLEDVSAQEAMHQVHRRLTIHLCAKCYGGWIENPAGG